MFLVCCFKNMFWKKNVEMQWAQEIAQKQAPLEEGQAHLMK